MSLILNNGAVVRAKENLSHRQRFLAYRDEIRYCHEQCVKHIDQHIEHHFTQRHVFVVLTTPDKERNIFGTRLVLDQLSRILVAAGRLSSFDDKPKDERPIVRLIQRDLWKEEKHAKLMDDLLETYCVLVDSWYLATAEAGQHANRVRHSKVTERELRHAMRFITEGIK
jgi:hypothetical protein